MRKLFWLLLVLLLFAKAAVGQITGTILDKTTKKPVAYANIWVENEDVGVTSTEAGGFTFADEKAVGKVLVVSCLGYERGRFTVTAGPMVLHLQPSAVALQEVVVKKSKRRKKLVLNNLKKAKVSHSFGTHGGPWIVADFLPYSQSFEATPFLEEIAFTTSSDVQNARFHIRLFEVNENGEPGKDLTTTPLVGFAPKGRQKTITLDVSQYNLQVPSKGMFIAFEWLIIEENKHEFMMVSQGKETKAKGVSYEPAINSRRFKTVENITWTYRQGKWSDKGMNGKGIKGTMFQVTLSN